MNGSWPDLPPAPHPDLPPVPLPDESDILYTYYRPSSVALIVLYSLTFLVGFTGNLLILALLVNKRRMDKVANAFMLNLAVCDLLVICLCVPINLGMEIYRSYVYGWVLCKTLPYIQAVVVSTSVMTLTVVSLDRFMAICYPLRAKVLSTRSRVNRAVLVTWLFSATIMLPIAIFSEIKVEQFTYPYQVDLVMCMENWPSLAWKQIYDLTLFVVLLVLPLGTMCVTYRQVALKLWRRDTVFRKKAGQPHCRMNSKHDIMHGRRRVVTVFMALTAFFAISWLPYFCLVLWFDFQDPLDIDSAQTAAGVFPFLQCLGIANSAIDPICYCISDRTVRKLLRVLRECAKMADPDANKQFSFKSDRSEKNGRESLRSGKHGRESLRSAKHGKESFKSCGVYLDKNGGAVTSPVNDHELPYPGQAV